RKLAEVILKKKHIYPETKAGELTEQVKRDLVGFIKRFPYRVTGHGSFAESQVTSGGVPLNDITDDFGSRLCPGLYITGELLDADGKCGGYNLHFAWGSGKLAAEAILRGKG
ncbi:MAG: NAD(P)/FAD-dependent oxidoreductase, partial [Lachnospiraceae bacterium]|nr:NAD(P)/FAD-dependent oxidoreductase [Lachnospiraceae bacterium]